ncbi:MAG: CHAT domain-containing protein, partial [Proteobacteria bacterium]|nr:CHAT domain-containing protein [Pseudomonadota bacterium]
MTTILRIFLLFGLVVLLGGRFAKAQTATATTGTDASYQELLERIQRQLTASQFTETLPLVNELVTRTEAKYGLNHTNTADALHLLADVYERVSDYTNATVACARALAIREKIYGPEHPLTAASLNILALLYFSEGEFKKSAPLLERSLKIYEKVFGPEHRNTATTFNNLANLYQTMGDYEKAAEMVQRSLKIREKVLGPEHPETATALASLSIIYRKLGDYPRAVVLSERSLKIREKVLGPEHPDTATALANLAVIYHGMGDYEKAVKFSEQGLKVRERVLGPEHPDTAMSLSTLAESLRQMADYATAESLLQRSLKISEKVFGKENLNTAVTLNNLGVLYSTMGASSKAEPVLLRSLGIYQKVFGPSHPQTALAMNNLAELYRSMGDYVRAKSLYQLGLKVYEKVLGPDHPDTAMSLNNLALLYLLTEDFQKAEPLNQRAVGIYEKALGPDHPETAKALNNLALLYSAMGEYAKAEPLSRRSLKIYEKVFGPEHPDTAKALNNVGLLCHEMGDPGKAEPLFKRCLGIYEKVFGLEHADTTTTLLNLGITLIDLHKTDEALAVGQKCRLSSEGALGQLLSFSSERQRMNYQANARPPSTDLLATLGSARELLTLSLRNKGIVLDSLVEDELTARASKEPSVKEALAALRAVTQRLMQHNSRAASDTSPESLKKRQAEKAQLEGQLDTAQKALARNVASLGQVRRALGVTSQNVQAALAKDTVLLEFIQYSHYLGHNKFETRYGALVVGHESVALKDAKVGEPVWIPLATEEVIERNLQDYRAVMRGEKKGAPDLLRSLYGHLFEPIQRRLPKDVTTLIISADAELNFVSFATLVDAQKRFLAEQYSIRYVAGGRDLMNGPTGQNRSRSYAAFANPSFTAKPTVLGSTSTDGVQMAGQDADRRDYAGISFGALPNTSLEAQFLRDKSKAWRLEGAIHVGAEASEIEVRAVQSPYILHLATHGFFLPDNSPTNRSPIQTRMTGEQRRPVVFHNPMQRSGLAFAGAQLTLDAWKRGEVPPTENDGILTAQEVGTMDLKDT